MAIPAIPSNFLLNQANGQIALSWDIDAGATSYIIQRSLDGVNYSTLTTVSGVPLYTRYVDTTVVLGTKYWYQIAGTSSDGTSGYTDPQYEIPAPTGEMSLYGIRTQAKQRADRVNSNFVTVPEWNSYINQAMYELYDLLITTYEDYFVSPTPAQFVTDGTTYLYPLPDGSTTFINGITGQGTFVAPAIYKLDGVDLAIQSANQAFVTVNRFQFIDRNKYVYPNAASTLYGVFNLQYRMLGNKIEFIPTPSANQPIRLWYTPRLNALLQDTDITTIGFSGWLEYVIVRAAKYALDKEESDTSKLDAELLFLKGRIEESAQSRDEGQPDKISDIRNGGWWSGMGGIGSGPGAGW